MNIKKFDTYSPIIYEVAKRGSFGYYLRQLNTQQQVQNYCYNILEESINLRRQQRTHNMFIPTFHLL